MTRLVVSESIGVVMKTKILMFVVLCACLGALSACSGVTRSITVTAPDALDICELYISPAGEDNYGDNQVAEDAPLAAQSEAQYPVDQAGDYDVKMVACDGQEAVLTVNVP